MKLETKEDLEELFNVSESQGYLLSLSHEEITKIMTSALALADHLEDKRFQLYTLYRLAWNYNRINDMKNAREMIERSRPIVNSLELGSPLEIWKAQLLFQEGITSASEGQQVKSIDCFNRALPFFKAFHIRQRELETMQGIGVTLLRIGNIGAAVNYFLDIIRIHSEEGSATTYSHSAANAAYYNLAYTSFKAGDLVTAWEYYHETHKLEFSKLPPGSILLSNLRIMLLVVEGRVDEAYEESKKVLKEAREYGSSAYLALALKCRAGTNALHNRLSEAIHDFEEALLYAQESPVVCSILTYLAELYAKRQLSTTDSLEVPFSDVKLARDYLARADQIVGEISEIEKPECLERISRTYELLGDTDKALSSLKRVNECRTALYSGYVRNQITTSPLLSKIEREENERKLEQMKREQTEKELANSTMHLAMQTELLGNFRNRLRQITREIDEPLAALKKIKEELKTLPCESIDWTKFEKEFTSVHPEFKAKITEKYPDLTKQEVKMCQLARLGLKNIEMAQLLCLSERSIESHRFNLRKKLGLKTEQKLSEFLSTVK